METTAIKTLISVSSTAFQHEEYIPKKYTCQGAGISSPLTINEIPEHTRCLALIVEDLDAPVNVYGLSGTFLRPTTSRKTQCPALKEKTAAARSDM